MTGLLNTLQQPAMAQWFLKAEVASLYLITIFLFLFFRLTKTPLEPMWNSIIWSIHGKVLHGLALWRITFTSKILLLTLNLVLNVHTVPCRKLHPSRPETVDIKCWLQGQVTMSETLQETHRKCHWKNRWNNLLMLQTGAVNSLISLDALEGSLRNLQFVQSPLWWYFCRQAMQREFTGCKVCYVKQCDTIEELFSPYFRLGF